MPLNKSKRLAIFVFFDKQGIVDDYVVYLLKCLKPFISGLAIAVNGNITENGQKKLSAFTKDIFIRKNIGFDAGAVKDVLLNFYGLEKVLKYDELLIANDTFYGPFFDLKDTFNKMDKTECDFWGITMQAALKGKYPEHIQSYFLNIKAKMLHSYFFADFFKNLSYPKKLRYAVKNYEIGFSQKAKENGFSYSAYIDAGELVSSYAVKNFNYSLIAPLTLLKNKCPFIKIKSLHYFGSEYLLQGGEQKGQIIRFIKSNTNYGEYLIWQSLLRRANISDIKNALHLNYAFPKNTLIHPSLLVAKSGAAIHKKILVIVHLFYEDLADECFEYLDNVPTFIDIVATTSNCSIAKKIKEHFKHKKNFQVRLIENRGRDIAALLVACRDIAPKYDYLCFTHDKKQSGKLTSAEAMSFRYLLWECTLASGQYIENIIGKFEQEPYLGFLGVPVPFHGRYFEIWKRGDKNFKNIKKLEKQLNLNCQIKENDDFFAIGTAFWARTTALKPLFDYNFSVSDFPQEDKNFPLNGGLSHAIERIFPYCAASEGYYSGTTATNDYSQIRISYLEHIIREREREREFLIFKEYFSKIYVYGAGEWAKKCAKSLRFLGINWQGFIVSKKQKAKFLRKPIFELGEIEFNKNIGIILGLDKENTEQVWKILKSRNVNENNVLKIKTD